MGQALRLKTKGSAMTPRAQGKAWAEKVKITRFVLSDMSENESSEMKVHPHGAWLYYHDHLKSLKAEHARAVRICRQARMLKFHGLRDTDTNEWLDGYEAACCDILTALQRGRGGKG